MNRSTVALNIHRFFLHVPPEDLRAYYAGEAQQILVTTVSGVRVAIPARAFRGYVTHHGLRGSFKLVVDDANRLVQLEKIG